MARSIHALVDRGHLKAGRDPAGAGRGGRRRAGRDRTGQGVWARASSRRCRREDKAQAAREAGADETIVYARAPFDKDQSKALADSFKAAGGKTGYDVIYDPVGGDYAEPALRSDRVGRAVSGRRLPGGHPAPAAQPHPAEKLRRVRRVLGRLRGARAGGEPRAYRAAVRPVGRGQDRAARHRDLRL